MHWMIMPYKRYADFSGRSRRMEYWMFQLFFWAVLIGWVFLAYFLDQLAGGGPGHRGPLGDLMLVGLGLFVVLSIIPHIAVTVRRFHDQGQSGWMYLLNFIPYIGGLIVLVFMFIDGTIGPNRYGPDPKNSDYRTNADIFG